jgi:6-pyruvoyltetrahydropterin/6-carboxytetrahydropterin synthase
MKSLRPASQSGRKTEREGICVFRITVEKSFNASHQLRLPDGSREKRHSHDWQVRATVAAERLDGMGLVMDFRKLAGMIDEVVRPLAGSELESAGIFANINASAENVAKYIYEGIEPGIEKHVRLESVEVMESPGCWAKYSKGQVGG